MIYNSGSIFCIILFFPVGNCWLRYKRAGKPNLSPTGTAGLYDQLKETLAPILQEKIDLISTFSNDADDNAEQRYRQRFKKNTKPTDGVLSGSILSSSSNLASNSAALAPHGVNESMLLNEADHEHEYDYGDQDLPDIEESSPDVFVYNHANDSGAKPIKLDNLNPVPLNPLSCHLAVNKEIAGKFDHNYEKCKRNLASLVKPSFEVPLKLVKKSLTPYEECLPSAQASKCDHIKSAAYSSLYDECKKRLQDFSSELGIDAGLDGLGENSINSETIMSANTKTWNALQDASADKDNKDALSSIKKRQNNPKSVFGRVSVRTSRADPKTIKNNVKPDLDLWLQKRGYKYKNSAKITGGGYDDDSHMTALKNRQKPKRFFRDLKILGNNCINEKDEGTNAFKQKNGFPDVLVEPLQVPSGTDTKVSARGLLDDLANKLNMSPLDVARKIANIEDLNLTNLKSDPDLHRILKQYIENSVFTAAQMTTKLPKIKEFVKKIVSAVGRNNNDALTASSDGDSHLTESAANNGCPWEQSKIWPNPSLVLLHNNKSKFPEEQVPNILEKLITKLYEIENNKMGIESNDEMGIEDTPCKLNGSWVSEIFGLRFDLTVRNTTANGLRETQSYGLKIAVREAVPPRQHDLLDTSWPFTGSSLKRIGGPFFLYTQKQSENILATFVGFCRSCNNRDTIYGTWSFSMPAKSCEDTAASFQTKNDVMHRYTLDEKRRERYKDLVYKKSEMAKENP